MWWENDWCPWVFGGQANASWPILPTAWRAANPVLDGVRQTISSRLESAEPLNVELRWNTGSWISGKADFGPDAARFARQLTIDAAAEVALVYDLTHSMDRASLQLPIVGELPPDPMAPDWLHAPNEPLLADELGRWLHLPEMLPLAQHYGLPTRLVDWSTDPIASAFFALDDEVAADGPGVTVFALHTGRTKDVALEPTSFPQLFDEVGPDDNGFEVRPHLKLLRPVRSANPNLAAQSGLFTMIGGSGVDFLRRDGRRVDLETFVAESRSPDALLKVSLDKAHIDDARRILTRERVSRSSLMPSIATAAQDVAARWQGDKYNQPM